MSLQDKIKNAKDTYWPLENWKTIDEDYIRFCRVCGWNDSDFGCTSPSGEEVWQCPMYIHYHPAEVEKFNEDMSKRKQSQGEYRWNG